MPRGLVLNFHREKDLAIFERGIVAVKKRYRFVSLPELQELLASKKSVKNIAHISFDDADNTFYENAYPVLKKYGLPASLFVSPTIIEQRANFWFQDLETFDESKFRNFLATHIGITLNDVQGYTTLSILKCFRIKEIMDMVREYKILNGSPPIPPFNMSLEQLLEVDRSGLVTIGAHTLDHPILKNETDEESSYQIAESIRHLQQLLKHPVNYFAFPNGVEGYDFTEREVNYLKKAGIALAFSTHTDHLVNMSSIYKVPRVYYATTFDLKPDHPLIMWRLALGNRWPQLRRRSASETGMRDAVCTLLKSKQRLAAGIPQEL